MKKSLFEKTWFIVLMAFIVPPFAIYLIWSKKKNANKVIKTILTIVLGYFSLIWFVCVLAVFVGETDTDTSVSEPDTNTAVATTLLTTEEYATQEETTEETKEEITEEFATVESTEDKETTKKSTVAENTTKKSPTTEKTTKKPTTTEKKTTTTTKKITEKETEKTTKPTTTKKPTTTQDPDEKITVYRTPTGKKYHYKNPCGNGTYTAISLAEAKRQGLTKCSKCG